MKKLLLILLCVPLIGFGQIISKINNIYSFSEYDLLGDYKLLTPAATDSLTDLKSLIDYFDSLNYELIDRNGLIQYHNAVNPFIQFQKNIGMFGFQIKLVHIYDNKDLSKLNIWKIENIILKNSNVKKNKKFDLLADKIIDDKKLVLEKSTSIYNYPVSHHWIKNISIADRKIYSIKKDRCNINFYSSENLEDDLDFLTNELKKECMISVTTGSKRITREGSKMLMSVYSVEKVGLSEFMNKLSLIGENWINEKIRIPIIKENNMKFVMVKIGSNVYKFLIDSGASDLFINSEVKNDLLNDGIITNEDLKNKKSYQIANGEYIETYSCSLQEIDLNGYKFKNISTAIGDEKSPLLLGMSVLEKFNWKITENFLELERK